MNRLIEYAQGFKDFCQDQTKLTTITVFHLDQRHSSASSHVFFKTEKYRKSEKVCIFGSNYRLQKLCLSSYYNINHKNINQFWSVRV